MQHISAFRPSLSTNNYKITVKKKKIIWKNKIYIRKASYFFYLKE